MKGQKIKLKNHNKRERERERERERGGRDKYINNKLKQYINERENGICNMDVHLCKDKPRYILSKGRVNQCLNNPLGKSSQDLILLTHALLY